MDALRTIPIVGGLSLLLCACELPAGKPAVQPLQPQPEELPPSEVVKAEEPPKRAEAEDPEMKPVELFVRRIDEMEQRAQRVGPAQVPAPQPPAPDPPADEPQVPAATLVAQHIAGPPAPATQSAAVAPPGARRTESAGSGSTAPSPTATAPAAPPPAPVLASVSARAVAGPSASVKPRVEAVEAPPRVNVGASAAVTPMSLTQLLDHWPDNSSGASFQQQLDLRLLRVAAGEYEAARQPLAAVSAQQQEMANRLVESLIAIRDAHDGDPDGSAGRVLTEIDHLREYLRRNSELRLPTLAICQEVSGFGQYRLIEPPRFPAGTANELVAYCEVRDFVSEKREDGQFETRFEMRTRVLDSAGEIVLDLRDADIVDRCRQPRQDCFIPKLVRLPATLSPGEYVVKITLLDKLGSKVAENRAAFRIVGR